MLHPHTEIRKVSDTVGYGVFATKPIPRGTITWALDPFDQVFGLDQTEGFKEAFGETFINYTWITARGERVLCWDFGKFVNHSCEANCLGPGGCEFEIAVRDIAVGEELTSDYGTLNLSSAMDCQCGAARCRGLIEAADIERHAEECDERIRAAFPAMLSVEQPLWRWVKAQHPTVEDLVSRPESIPSVIEHRWSPLDQPRGARP